MYYLCIDSRNKVLVVLSYSKLHTVTSLSPAPEQLCVNITSSLIYILKTTQASWRQDLQNEQIGNSSSAKEQILKLQTHHRTLSGGAKAVPEEEGSEPSKVVSTMERGLALLHSVRFVSQTRQRMRFVPFLLRNSTGLPLRFATLTSVPSKVCRWELFFTQMVTLLKSFSSLIRTSAHIYHGVQQSCVRKFCLHASPFPPSSCNMYTQKHAFYFSPGICESISTVCKDTR